MNNDKVLTVIKVIFSIINFILVCRLTFLILLMIFWDSGIFSSTSEDTKLLLGILIIIIFNNIIGCLLFYKRTSQWNIKYLKNPISLQKIVSTWVKLQSMVGLTGCISIIIIYFSIGVLIT